MLVVVAALYAGKEKDLLLLSALVAASALLKQTLGHTPVPSTNAASARSTALPSAAALLTVSSYSLSGTLSATTPAPACMVGTSNAAG